MTPPHSGGLASPVAAAVPTAPTPTQAANTNVGTATPNRVPSRADGRHGDEVANKVLVTRMADEETEDGRIRNREAMAKIRDAWVYKQVRERVGEFTEYRQVSKIEKQIASISIVSPRCIFYVSSRKHNRTDP